jgi:hypothetical protein
MILTKISPRNPVDDSITRAMKKRMQGIVAFLPRAIHKSHSCGADKHDPRERGMLVSLHDTILENFPVLLRRLAKGDRASVTTDGPEDRSSQVCTEPISFPVSDPNTASQYASLQRAFIRFDIWGRDFDVASGLLEKKLEHSEDLREDIILVLLQLCDALYQSKCSLRMKTANAHQRLTWNRSSSSHEERICHISNGAAEYSANSRNCQVLRWRG